MSTVREKLDNFIETNKIPHIVFHGPSGSGKRTLVNEFVGRIYSGDPQKISEMTMFINCAHGKGIKFVREELNIFAKMNINHQQGQFKTIILSNADELTIDAQSALRRCIELYSHHTRFFVIIETHSKLLRPILSRFCEIYVTNRENLNKKRTQSVCQTFETPPSVWFQKYMDKLEIKDNVDALEATRRGAAPVQQLHAPRRAQRAEGRSGGCSPSRTKLERRGAAAQSEECQQAARHCHADEVRL